MKKREKNVYAVAYEERGRPGIFYMHAESTGDAWSKLLTVASAGAMARGSVVVSVGRAVGVWENQETGEQTA